MKPNRYGWVPWLAAAALGAAAALRLASILPAVANRQAFGWDSARRAVLNARAGDALRTGHLLDFLWYVAGPETWPTLRLVPASVLHAIAGPRHAFAVEQALSIATVAGILLAVAWAARALTEGTVAATLVTLLSTALLAGNHALLTHAANGMLEPLSAALTTAAVAAWIEARTRGSERPWALALMANLLFHAKWQHGLLLTIAVLLLEATGGGPLGPREAWRATGGALAATVRARSGAALLAVAALLGALAVAIGLTGGGSTRLGGVGLGLRTVHGPIAWGALAAFLLVELAFWRGRAALRAVVPARLRFSWAWVATPMAAWLLVPGTWRVRTLLVTSATYDSGEALRGPWVRVLFYPDAAWGTWTAAGLHPLVLALLAATVVAVWRSAPVRRRLTPILAVVAVEWIVLTFGTRHNFQARFAANLAPLVALALSAWLAALPARWAAPAGCAAILVAAIPSAATWGHDRLVAVVGEGFDPADHAASCRSLMERLPVERFPLVNHAPLSHRQGCALWATTIARDRGERPTPDGLIVVTTTTDPAPAPPGFEPASGDVVAGPLRGRVYRRR